MAQRDVSSSGRVSEARLKRDLGEAIARGELSVGYQPIVSLNSGTISGCEALLRWAHPQLGRIPPDRFIPLAEASELILSIGAWCLRQACAEAATWPGDVKIAVNVSAKQFQTGDFPEILASALSGSGLGPSRLDIEITETVLLADSEQVLAQMRRLQGLGVQIALDDFGTGYSSLHLLRTYPFDKIKIDRSFVSGGDDDALIILRSISGLGRDLGIATTAEGVETPEQLDLVRLEGCTHAQGFLFSQPKPANEVLGLIRNGGAHFKGIESKSSYGWHPGGAYGTQGHGAAAKAVCQEVCLDGVDDFLDGSSEVVFEPIVRLAKFALGAPMATVALGDKGHQRKLCWPDVPTNDALHEQLCAFALERDHEFAVCDVRRSPRFRDCVADAESSEIRAFAAVPMRTADGRKLGVLCVGDIRPRRFTRGQLLVLRDLARLVSDEFDLWRLTTVDGLTGALAQRAFCAELDRELLRVRRWDGSLSCIIFRIENLKDIGDRYGNEARDLVLRAVSELCKSVLRPTDRFGRLGSDEFGILLPRTDLDQATLLSRRIRELLSELALPFGSVSLPVKANFGVTRIGIQDQSARDMLSRADCALHRAKKVENDEVAAYAPLPSPDASLPG